MCIEKDEIKKSRDKINVRLMVEGLYLEKEQTETNEDSCVKGR